jgi:hypothetical protein
MRLLAALAALVIAACGSSSPSGDDSSGDDGPAPDAAPAGWEKLISSTWTIPGGEEYLCERLTIDHDVWIKGFHAAIPQGHHHAVLTVYPTPNGADGQYPCDAATNAPAMIYGNAPGTEDIQFPDGVAVEVPAGAQLNLNLHLFNTQPAGDITGTSEVYVQTVDPSAVQHEAEIVLMGPVGFPVPSGPSMVTGTCTASAASTIFMTNPHMHKLGVHDLIVAHRAAGDMTLRDADYSFSDQQFYDTGLVEMAQGDSVSITCSYDNPGDPTMWGQSTNQEMCFASTYRYPKLGANFGIVCSD